MNTISVWLPSFIFPRLSSFFSLPEPMTNADVLSSLCYDRAGERISGDSTATALW